MQGCGSLDTLRMRDFDVGDSVYADIVNGVKMLPQLVFAQGIVGRVEYETVSTLLQPRGGNLGTSSLDCHDCLQSFVLNARRADVGRCRRASSRAAGGRGEGRDSTYEEA